MDRDRVNEVLYNRPYDSLYNRCFGWLGLWAEWKHVLEYGADALRCTDGQILNGMFSECQRLALTCWKTGWMS